MNVLHHSARLQVDIQRQELHGAVDILMAVAPSVVLASGQGQLRIHCHEQLEVLECSVNDVLAEFARDHPLQPGAFDMRDLRNFDVLRCEARDVEDAGHLLIKFPASVDEELRELWAEMYKEGEERKRAKLEAGAGDEAAQAGEAAAAAAAAAAAVLASRSTSAADDDVDPDRMLEDGDDEDGGDGDGGAAADDNDDDPWTSTGTTQLRVQVTYRLRAAQAPVVGLQFNPEEHQCFSTTFQGGTSAWMPCVDALDQRFSTDLVFVVAQHLVAVASGRLVEHSAEADGSSWKSYHFSLGVPVCARALGFVVGSFVVLPDPKMESVTHFAPLYLDAQNRPLDGSSSAVAAAAAASFAAAKQNISRSSSNTTTTISSSSSTSSAAAAAHDSSNDGPAVPAGRVPLAPKQQLKRLKCSTTGLVDAMRTFHDYLHMNYPFGCYNQVFVDNAYMDGIFFAGLSIISVHTLVDKTIVDQTFETRKLQARMAACSWIGHGMYLRSHADSWIAMGLAEHLTSMYVGVAFGQNERQWQRFQNSEWLYDMYIRGVHRQLNIGPASLEHPHGIDYSAPPKPRPPPEEVISEAETNKKKKKKGPKDRNKEGWLIDSGNTTLDEMANTTPPPEIEYTLYEQFRASVVRDPFPVMSLASPLQWDGNVHPTDLYTRERTTKAGLVMRVFELHIGPGELRLLAQDMMRTSVSFNSTKAVSTKRLLKSAKKLAGGQDMSQFALMWIEGEGYPDLRGLFRWSKKKTATDILLRQDDTYNRVDNTDEALRFSGEVTIRVCEAERVEEHKRRVDDIRQLYDFNCKSRLKRNRKRRIVREEDLSLVELLERIAVHPVLYIRLDPEMEWFHMPSLHQDELMWCEQLRRERDVLAQLQALRCLRCENDNLVFKALYDALCNSQLFHRVRSEAAYAMARNTANRALLKRSLPALQKFFVANFFQRRANVVRPNDFADFPKYFLQVSICDALSFVRCRAKRTPDDIVEMLVDLLEHNDNSKNRFSDSFYVASLLRCIGHCCVGRGGSRAPLLRQIDRYMQYDLIIPSYNREVTKACLESLVWLQLSHRKSNETKKKKAPPSSAPAPAPAQPQAPAPGLGPTQPAAEVPAAAGIVVPVSAAATPALENGSAAGTAQLLLPGPAAASGLLLPHSGPDQAPAVTQGATFQLPVLDAEGDLNMGVVGAAHTAVVSTSATTTSNFDNNYNSNSSSSRISSGALLGGDLMMNDVGSESRSDDGSDDGESGDEDDVDEFLSMDADDGVNPYGMFEANGSVNLDQYLRPKNIPSVRLTAFRCKLMLISSDDHLEGLSDVISVIERERVTGARMQFVQLLWEYLSSNNMCRGIVKILQSHEPQDKLASVSIMDRLWALMVNERDPFVVNAVYKVYHTLWGEHAPPCASQAQVDASGWLDLTRTESTNFNRREVAISDFVVRQAGRKRHGKVVVASKSEHARIAISRDLLTQ